MISAINHSWNDTPFWRKTQANRRIASGAENQAMLSKSKKADSPCGEELRTIRRMLAGSDAGKQESFGGNRVIQDSLTYSESLKASRTKRKDTSLQKKRLQYSFKKISSQILRCKTSYSAKQVVGQAKREVMRLKRQRKGGEYDNEELELAITHAQAMERVAKKKARHLEEEEMAQISGGVCAGDLEEKEAELSEEELTGGRWREENAGDMDSVEEMTYSPETIMMELVEALSEEMAEMLEDMGLADLLEGVSMPLEHHMDPADFKMIRIKHRTKEMREIARADSAYLKAVFDKLARDRALTAGSLGQNAGSSGCAGVGVDLSASSASGVLPVAAVSIDISV